VINVHQVRFSIRLVIKIVKAELKIKNEQALEKKHIAQKEIFKTQDVPMTLDYPNAYTGCEQLENNYDRRGKYRPVSYHNNNSATFRERYRLKLVPQIDQFKASYKDKFMIGTNNSLVLPCNLTFTIPAQVKELLEYNIGELSYEYSVENDLFTVTNYYVFETNKVPISSKSYPYDNSDLWFYWIGGDYSKGQLFRDHYREGIYDNWCMAPLPTTYAGIMHSTVTETNILVTVTLVDELTRIKKIYNDKFQDKLLTGLQTEENSAFSKAVLELSYQHYMIKDIYNINVANKEMTRLEIISELKVYSPTFILANPTFERKNYTSEVFNHVMAILDAKIEMYETKCVEYDDLNNSIHSSKLLNALSKAVMSCNSKTQAEILKSLQNTLQIEGNGLQMLLENNY